MSGVGRMALVASTHSADFVRKTITHVESHEAVSSHVAEDLA